MPANPTILGNATMQLTGIHHLTAISADAKGNVDFYTRKLGLRLVKKTVNQDDVSAYHLFYADGLGSPGTDLTFFDWPAAPERRGTNAIVRTALRVGGEASLAWWKEHLDAEGIKNSGVKVRDGRATILFEDPEGQRLALIDDGGVGEAHPWEKSPVAAEWSKQIRVSAEEVLASPFVLFGSVDQIQQRLLDYRERFGISYIAAFWPAIDALAPLVARLAGK